MILKDQVGRRYPGTKKVMKENRRITHFRVSCDFKFPAITKESQAEVALAHFKWDDHFSILATNSALFIIVFLLDCKLMCANLLAFAKQQNKFHLITYFYKTLKALLRLHFS